MTEEQSVYAAPGETSRKRFKSQTAPPTAHLQQKRDYNFPGLWIIFKFLKVPPKTETKHNTTLRKGNNFVTQTFPRCWCVNFSSGGRREISKTSDTNFGISGTRFGLCHERSTHVGHAGYGRVKVLISMGAGGGGSVCRPRGSSGTGLEHRFHRFPQQISPRREPCSRPGVRGTGARKRSWGTAWGPCTEQTGIFSLVGMTLNKASRCAVPADWGGRQLMHGVKTSSSLTTWRNGQKTRSFHEHNRRTDEKSWWKATTCLQG